MRSVIAVCFGSLVLWACGGPPAHARYSGVAADPVRTAITLEERGVEPADYTVLGRVWSACEAPEKTRELDEAWLKDVACSEELLTTALRDKAAAVGGEVLAGRSCARRDSDGGGYEITCSALVARSSKDAKATAALQGASADQKTETRDDALGLAPEQVPEAWRIAVDFTPANQRQAARSARQLHLVGERDAVPVNQRRLGDIVARCRGTCEQDSVRAAVRAGAARVGAHDVASLSCVEARPGWVCTGQASVYERTPPDDPATW